MTVSAYTSNFKLALIDFNSQNWSGDANGNLVLIDAVLKANFASAQFAVASGTNTITATYPTTPVYVAGLTLLFKLANAPTGPATFNGYPLLIAGAPISTGVLQAGDVVRALFDGANFNVLEPVRVFSALYIRNGGSGVTAVSTADDLVIDLNFSGGMSILSPANSTATIAFGNPTNATAGLITLNHSTGVMTITAANGLVLNEPTTVNGLLTVTSLTSTNGFTGNLTGNVTGNVSGTAGGLASGVVLPVAQGGTGVTTIGGLQSALGLNSLAYRATVSNDQWNGNALTIANGGTGKTNASDALAALGGAPLTKFVIQTQSGASYTGLTDGTLSFEY